MSNNIEWAPLDIPIARRIQTLALVVAMLFPAALLTLWIWMVLQSSFPLLRWIALAYLLWTFVDRAPSNGGRPCNFIQNLRFPFSYIGDYFPAKLYVTEPLDPDKLYVMAVHPHGIIGMSLWANIFSRLQHAKHSLSGGKGGSLTGKPFDFRSLTVSANFTLPLWREFLLSLGLVNAHRESAQNVLKDGNSVLVVVGGALESMDARPGAIRLTINCRKGFVKLALKHGASLVPIFCFGENDLYDQVKNEKGGFLHRLQEASIRLVGFALPVPKGRGIFQYTYGLLPHRKPLNTVAGKPIPLPRVENPSQEIIDQYHDEYKKALLSLYDVHKDLLGHGEELICC